VGDLQIDFFRSGAAIFLAVLFPLCAGFAVILTSSPTASRSVFGISVNVYLAKYHNF
jgi:hypothetical protein